jgi:hypothetical protein
VEEAAGDQSDGGAACADAAPEAERLVALGALVEHVHDDRERGGQHDRGSEPLQAAHRDQEAVGCRKRAGERGGGEDPEPEHQDASASQQIGAPAAEQEETAEGEAVGGDHPLQVRLAEVELAADRRQRDVHDRQVDDGHEVRDRKPGERAPAV